MTHVRPAAGSTPIELTFKLAVSDEWLEEQVVQTGQRPSKYWFVDVPLKDVPDVELRRELLALHRTLERRQVRPTLMEPPDDDFAEFARYVRTWLALTDAEEAQNDPAAGFEQERRQWIAAYGSERLRTAEQRGYKVNRLYALERGAAEYPGCFVDTGSSAYARERVDPSAEALTVETDVQELVERHGHAYEPRIVWLIQPPGDVADRLAEQGDPWEQQEAVRISSYLGRYELYLPVDPAYRREAGDGEP
jgi:hypothetical protein